MGRTDLYRFGFNHLDKRKIEQSYLIGSWYFVNLKTKQTSKKTRAANYSERKDKDSGDDDLLLCLHPWIQHGFATPASEPCGLGHNV